jgi:hypothetical protein
MLITSWIATLLFSRTHSFNQPTFSSVLLVDERPKCLVPSTEVTPIFDLGKLLTNVCCSHYLLSKSYFLHYESLHVIFSPVISSLPSSNCKWDNTHVFKQGITQQQHMLQPHSKQEVTQLTLLYLHVGGQKYVAVHMYQAEMAR